MLTYFIRGGTNINLVDYDLEDIPADEIHPLGVLDYAHLTKLQLFKGASYVMVF